MPRDHFFIISEALDQLKRDVKDLELRERPDMSSGIYGGKPSASLHTGQRYQSNDNGLDIYYTGTRWVTMSQLTTRIDIITLTATTTLQFCLPRDFDLFVDRIDLTVGQVNLGTATNYWSWALGTSMGISTGTVDTKLQGAGVNTAYAYTSFSGNPLTLANNTLGRVQVTFTQNNVGAGNLTLWATLTYRKVG